MGKSKGFKIPDARWPVDEAKSKGIYFNLEPVGEIWEGRVKVKGKGEMIMLGSYSYLGLLGHPKIEKAARQAVAQFSTGGHGVRLLAGTTVLHNKLEKKIAEYKNTETSIVYSSGYVANLSTISSLLRKGDTIISDKLNHASIVDGCFLSGAKIYRFNHNDMDHLEKRLSQADPNTNKLVVVDAVFSMDGDVINLPETSRLCKKYSALLMVDEAHSIGVLGKSGHGIEEHFDLPPDVVDLKMGTLSKAIPSMGGYVAAKEKIIKFLKHESRGFIYSAALAPAQSGAALKAFDIMEKEPKRIKNLQKNVARFIKGLNEAGFNTLNSETAIVPVVCGGNEKAWRMASQCQKDGLFVQGIPSPVVSEGTARLRCCLMASHTTEDIDYCIEIIKRAGKKIGII